MMIYFDENRDAYATEIDNPIASVDAQIWAEYCNWQLGVAYDIINGEFVQLWSIEFCQKKARAKSRIGELKIMLANSDYKTQKYIEGQLTEEEWAIAKTERQAWRDEIRELENLKPS